LLTQPIAPVIIFMSIGKKDPNRLRLSHTAAFFLRR
jgi:hypothetical protein